MTRFAPSGPLRGELPPPPDKSISHRAALIGAMCDDRVEVEAASERLREAAAVIRSGDASRVAAWHGAARDDRRRLLEADLAGGELHQLRIAVENRPGTVAEIALALGRAGVNIEDMALYPAPDMRTGAVSLWVAGGARAERAAEIVRALGHSVSLSE